MFRWHGKMMLAGLALAFALAGSARAQDFGKGCSNETLKGDYAFTINGQVFPPGKPVITRDGVAIARYDGKGGVTQVDFVMQYPDPTGNASPVPNGDTPDPQTNFNIGEQGTYKVFDDCTGEMEIDFPPIGAGGAIVKVRFVLSNEGRAIHATVYSAQPPGAPGPVPALIHSEGHKLHTKSDDHSRR